MSETILRFVSLRFQAAFFLVVLFVVVVLLMSFLSLDRMENAFIKDQQESHLKYQAHFQYLINMDVEHLVSLSEELLITQRLHKSQESYFKELQALWDDFYIADYLSGFSIFDRYNSEPVLSINPSYVPAEEKRLLADIALQENQVQSKISCEERCVVATAVSKRIFGQQVVFFMEQNLTNSVLELSNIDDLHVIFLGKQLTDNTESLQPFLAPWNRYVLSSTEYTPLLRAISSQVSLNKVSRDGAMLDHLDRTFMFWAFALEPNEQDSSHYILFLDDTTGRIAEIRQHFYDTLFYVFVSALILGVAILMLSARPLARIQRLARLLPKLAGQDFDIIPKKLCEQPKYFEDEIDVLEQVSVGLSKQLKALDKDVKEKAQELERAAMFDGLTGLANRSMFMFQLYNSVAQIGRQSNMLGLVFIDLDKFKAINDTLGHDLGDELLKNVASRLSKSVRETDLVCRLGGDEFVIILNNLQRTDDAERVMNKLMGNMSRSMRLGDYDINVTFSAGVAFAYNNEQDCDELLKNADIAMYEAKCKGRNKYEIFSQDMRDDTSRKFIIENGFKAALEQEQLSLRLIPKKRMGKDDVIGLEAICIWQHPTEGLITSEEFLPILEQNTLFVEYSKWLVRRVLRLLEHLEQRGLSTLHVSFNIPSKQFSNPLLSQQLHDCFSIYEGYQKRVDIEIGESTLLKDLTQASKTMQALKDMGFSLTMDHFGSGHASLASLSRMPFDYVKLDEEFVSRVADSPAEAHIVEAMVNMSHKLGLEVIADAINTHKEYEILHQCGCDYAQGPFIATPIDEKDIFNHIDVHTHELIK